MLALVGIAVGLAIGFAIGGDFASIGNVHIRGGTWMIALFVVQGFARGRLADFLPDAGRLAIVVWLISSSAILALLVLNRAIDGLPIAALGLGFNAAVVLANGAMPVAGVSSNSSSIVLPPMYEPIDATTRLAWLADIVTLRLWNAHYLISAGDVLLALGAATFVVAAMCSPACRLAEPGKDDD